MNMNKETPKRMPLTIVSGITIEQVQEAKPEHIYYGANTCWWTHDPAHLRKGSNGLPLDPTGGVLFYTDDIEGFLKSAEDNAAYYGKHGLDTFVAAHHLNCFIEVPGYGLRPWASPRWDDYNDGIDRMQMRKQMSGLAEILEGRREVSVLEEIERLNELSEKEKEKEKGK